MGRDRLGNAKDGYKSESSMMEAVDRYADGKGRIDEKGLEQAARDLNLDPDRLREMNIRIERQRRGAD